MTGLRVHWPRTLVAKGSAPIGVEHLRYKPKPHGQKLLHLVVLDCSASMLRGAGLSRAKGLLLDWSTQLYRRRAELAVIGFSGQAARLLQSPGKARPDSRPWIAAIGGGGRSPIEQALALAGQVMGKARRAESGQLMGLWLLSDCRFAVLPPAPAQADFCVVVDFEAGPVRLRRGVRLADRWGADYVRFEDLMVSGV